MTPLFDVVITELKSVHDIPTAWTPAVYRHFLEQAEFEAIDEIDDADMGEMAIMALQDLEPEEAAEIVLATLLGDRLSKGVRQNLVHEMKEDALWEQYAQTSCHADLFLAGVVLYRAFPKLFTYPDIGRLTLTMTPVNELAKKQLAAGVTAPFLARLLADAMDDHGLLKRLYEDQLAGNHFPTAQDIIWHTVMLGQQADGSVTYQLYSSWEWLQPLKLTRAYQSTAYRDAV
jgi:hypothetical protein